MIIYYKTTISGLAPADENEYEKFQQLGIWEGYVNHKKQRNTPNHRRFFKMLGVVYDNQELYNNIEHMRSILTMKAGYFDSVITSTGTTYLPQSIAYDKMDEIEFRNFFSKVIDAIIKEFDYNDEDYRNILQNFL